MTQIESDTSGLASGLGGKEGVEDLIYDLLFDTNTIIPNEDLHDFFFGGDGKIYLRKSRSAEG